MTEETKDLAIAEEIYSALVLTASEHAEGYVDLSREEWTTEAAAILRKRLIFPQFSDEELKELARDINNCFDNGCGCCSSGDDDLDEAVSILRSIIERSRIRHAEK